MPNLYVSEERIRTRLGSRATALLDRDNDGEEDEDLLESVIEGAGRIVNMRLAQRYKTPFASIGAEPSTPEEIEEVAFHLVLWDLYKWKWPDGPDARSHGELADTLLTGLLDGDFDLPAARVAAHEGRHIVSASFSEPVLSGRDRHGRDRLRGV